MYVYILWDINLKVPDAINILMERNQTAMLEIKWQHFR